MRISWRRIPLQAIERGEFATRFTLVCPLGERSITLKAGGMHNVGNALAAGRRGRRGRRIAR